MLVHLVLQLVLAASSVAQGGPRKRDGLISFPAIRETRSTGLLKRDGDESVPLYDESEVSYLIQRESIHVIADFV